LTGYKFTKTEREKITDFFFGSLLESFPLAASASLTQIFYKHLFEVALILELRTSEKPKLLDVGGGMGVNAIILSYLFGYECTVIDRYFEFLPEHNREVGDKFAVSERLRHFGVDVCEQNFTEVGFPYSSESFHVITCFDVIEHFNFSPKKLISEMAAMLKTSGNLLIGTPNQVHLYNRIKALLGKNTWEDFEYFYSAKHFYGHIREFTPGEFETVMSREPSLKFNKLFFSNYPIESKKTFLNAKFGHLPATAIRRLVMMVNYVVPNLNYYMVAVSTKS